MHAKGVIFDFNGTLFWDTPFHNQAWDIFLERRRMTFSDEEKHLYLHGKHNRLIFEFIFGFGASDQQMEAWVEEKESIYREICLQKGMKLAPGAEDFFSFLREKGIAFTIATASGKRNMEFFMEQFHLGQWFDFDHIIYDNGKIKGKPDPEVFILAAEQLNIKVSDCVIFEDSISGIQAARAACPYHLYVVASGEKLPLEYNETSISSFAQVDKSLFII